MFDHFWKIFISFLTFVIMGIGFYAYQKDREIKIIEAKTPKPPPKKVEVTIKEIKVRNNFDCFDMQDSLKNSLIALLFDCADNHIRTVPKDNSCVDMRTLLPPLEHCRNSAMKSICPNKKEFQTCFSNDSCSIFRTCDLTKTEPEILACQKG